MIIFYSIMNATAPWFIFFVRQLVANLQTNQEMKYAVFWDVAL
jgi:hypothetical protein